MQDEAEAIAIDAALKCDWAAAISANAKILKSHPVDVDCLNRLGRAYLETGDRKKAATFFRKVLKIDKYNPIALKNLSRAQDSTKTFDHKSPSLPTTPVSPSNFLEEPGKTRLVTLVNVAPASTLLKLNHGGALFLIPKRHTVIAEDVNHTYLGALPDDLGHRLSILIKGGNRYEATIKSLSKNSLVLFLRETFRAKRFHNTPSFLTTAVPDYLSFLREDNLEASEKSSLSTDGDDADTEGNEPLSKLHQDEEPDANG